MQVMTFTFDDHDEELYFTFHNGTVSIGSETRSIGSVLVVPLEPEVPDMQSTEPIVEEEEDELEVLEGELVEPQNELTYDNRTTNQGEDDGETGV